LFSGLTKLSLSMRDVSGAATVAELIQHSNSDGIIRRLASRLYNGNDRKN